MPVNPFKPFHMHFKAIIIAYEAVINSFKERICVWFFWGRKNKLISFGQSFFFFGNVFNEGYITSKLFMYHYCYLYYIETIRRRAYFTMEGSNTIILLHSSFCGLFRSSIDWKIMWMYVCFGKIDNYTTALSLNGGLSTFTLSS